MRGAAKRIWTMVAAVPSRNLQGIMTAVHYHQQTDEFYYVVDGEGILIMDDQQVELHRGVVVYVRHAAC